MNKETLKREALSWAKSIAIAVVLAMVIRYFVIESYQVEGTSMVPTLQNSERLFVNKFIYRFREPKTGDIIVLKYPSDTSKDFIKRVIAKSGDTLEIIDGRVLVNGTAINEPYINEPMRIANNYPKIEIPKGYVFVMGDNRNHSKDSRYSDVDLVSYDLIKGEALFAYWPLSQMRLF
ncbi:MAG: signal peptidase I [Bacillota bacterium]